MVSLRQPWRTALALRQFSSQSTRWSPPPPGPQASPLHGVLPATKHVDATAPDSATETTPRGKLRPRSVQALYLQPLRREAKYGIPCCDLQLRSYSKRNLDFYCDFALRAAYYCKLPAFGPVPLPRITERWTVPRDTFIFKKSQENFERVTIRRLIQIRDGHPDSVQLWLAFLQKYAYYGIGMKANVWEFCKLGVGKTMDEAADASELESTWKHMGQSRSLGAAEKIEELLRSKRFPHGGS